MVRQSDGYIFEHLRVDRVLPGEMSARNVAAAVIDGEAIATDGEPGARGTAGDTARRANLTNQIEQIKQLVTAHEGGLVRCNLVRAGEVVRLGLLMTAFLGANPRLKKKDLAGRIGKHAAWVTRFTQAARLADDPQHITADQATAILRKAHGKVRCAAKQGRVCTSQSLTARILRALHDAFRFHMPVPEIEACIEAARSLAGIAPGRNPGTEGRS